MGKLSSTDCRGFYITFENGLSVSAKWGSGNYCGNRYAEHDLTHTKDWVSETTEVAVLCDGRIVDPRPFVGRKVNADDMVGKYLTPEQLVDLLMKVKNYPKWRVSRLRKRMSK